MRQDDLLIVGEGRKARRVVGSLAEAMAATPTVVDVTRMSGPDLARSMMVAQLGQVPPERRIQPGPRVVKPSSRERRLARMRAGALTLEKLNSGL